MEDFGKTLASIEHYFKLEIEEQKKRSGGLNEGGEGHEELGSPHMNEGGNNDMSPLHEYVSPPIEPAAMEAQVPGDGAEPFASMVVQEAEMVTSVPHIQVHEAAEQAEFEKLPTPEDVAGCNEICKRLLFLLEDWEITDSMLSGGLMNPPSIPKVSVAGDKEGSASVEKQEVEGKGCRKKCLVQTLLSPFIDPLRKKRTTTVSDAAATPPCFNPTKPLPIEDVKAVIEFCTTWKNDISAEVQLESCSMGPEFFYKLIDAIEWIGSRPVKGPTKKRGSKKVAASNTVDLPPSNLNNIHHYVHGTWQHGYGQAWTKVWKVYFLYNLQGSHWVAIEIDFVRHTATAYDSYIAFTSTSKLVKYLHPISDTLPRVLYEVHFYDTSEVQEVKQKGMKMSTFTPFTVCSIGDVPQQRDATSCGILTVKFIEYLSASISLDKVDHLKIKYY
ncbi:unnamed protein product [Prunus armeniaca]